MKNAKISYQSYGSSILVFIEGKTPADAYGRYLSFWNWNGTCSEPEYVTEFIISCWSTIERLQFYLFNMRVNELLDAGGDTLKGKKDGVKDEAAKLAMQDFDEIEREAYRSINSNYVEHSFGTMAAEKPDNDYNDYKDECYKVAFASN